MPNPVIRKRRLLSTCLGLVAAAAACMLAAPATASPRYAPPAQRVACELHVWPVGKFKAYSSGWSEVLGGGALAAALDHGKSEPKSVKAVLKETMGGDTQASLLRELDLPSLLDASEVTVIPHEVPTDPAAFDRIAGRRSDSASPCYIELIVTKMFFQEAATIAPSLRVHFTLRRFDPGRTAPVVTKGNMAQRLSRVPAADRSGPELARYRFREAYKRDFAEFINEEVKGLPSED